MRSGVSDIGFVPPTTSAARASNGCFHSLRCPGHLRHEGGPLTASRALHRLAPLICHHSVRWVKPGDYLAHCPNFWGPFSIGKLRRPPEPTKDQADLRVGQSPLPRAGEEYPLVVYQLRLGESVRGAAPAIGRGLAGVCANRVVGSLMAGEPRSRRAGPSGFPVLIHPETDFFVQT